jgi:hypothetical protein
MREKEESEDGGMISYVQPDQRTIHATFGSDPVRHVEAMITHEQNNGGLYHDEVTVDLGNRTGFTKRMQDDDEKVQSEEEVWVDVTMWCPGGNGCQEYEHGGLSNSRRAKLRQGTTAVHGSDRDWKENGEAIISFPDLIIEPPHSGSYSTPVDYIEAQRPAIMNKPYHPSIYQPQRNNNSEPSLFPPNSWSINTQRLPTHPFTPILLHSPFRPPRWLTYSAFLSLHQHYSQPDPMLGRKGCWKCSLCGTGSRIPLGEEAEVGQRAVELSELGISEHGNSLQKSVRSGAGSCRMDGQEKREFLTAVDILVRKGRGRGKPRFEGNRSTTEYLFVTDQSHGSDNATLMDGHSDSPLYSPPDSARKRDRRISMQVEPYRRVRKAIVSDEDVLRHGPHKEI